MLKSLLKCSLAFCSAVCFLLTPSTPAHAQYIKAFSGDVSANVGFNNLNGVDNKKHPEFGFSGGANLIKQIAVLGEFTYLPQGSATQSGLSVSGNYQLYGAAIRYSPLPNYRVVPYIVLGEGYARVSAAASFGGSQGSASLNGSYTGGGGGISIYGGHNWGVRPEFRWDRQLYSSNGQNQHQDDVRGMIALFYQWKPWQK